MGENNSIKLDSVDRQILYELDKNCRIASTVLARKVKKSRQAVEYRINQLVTCGVITGFHTSFNPHKMGYKIYKIYLKLRNIPLQKKELLAYLQSCGTVYWMGECSGTWDLIFGIFAKTDYEFYTVKNDITSRFSSIIVAEEGQILLDVKQFPKMYITNQLSTSVMFAGEIVSNEFDSLDFSILQLLVGNGRISVVDLARRVKSTVSIVITRMKRLEREGVIIQYRVGINLNLLGYELYKAIISLDKFTEQDAKKFDFAVSQLTQTQYYIRNLWNIELELVVGNYQEYYRITEHLKTEFAQVIRTVDSVLMITDEWTPGFSNMFVAK